MSTRPRVAVLVESSRGYGRGVLQGIAAYVREHEPWTIHHHERRLYDAAPAWLKRWKGSGIIARIANGSVAKQIARLRLPTVDLVGRHDLQDVPVVISDHHAISKLAADHLLGRGLNHFAFCGYAGVHYSERRLKSFVEYLGKLGHTVRTYTGRRIHRNFDVSVVDIDRDSPARTGDLAMWLKSLPKPVGLMVGGDYRGHQVLNLCAECGIIVPDEVAVIGVDNDEVLCDLCDPPLTSIALNSRKIGYEAAAILDRMMKGGRPPKRTVLVPPLGVVMRRSTDMLSLPDADLAAAVRFIRERACEGIGVEDVVRHVNVSRSTLKRRFSACLHRSPMDEIHRIRIERVKQLLGSSRLPLAQIAERTGFQCVESMCKLFKQRTGITPGRFRKTWTD